MTREHCPASLRAPLDGEFRESIAMFGDIVVSVAASRMTCTGRVLLKRLVMVPVRTEQPVGKDDPEANYEGKTWSKPFSTTGLKASAPRPRLIGIIK
jgi:hypothetical protein